MKYLVVDLEATDPYLTGITEIIEFGYAVIQDNEIQGYGGSFIKPVYSRLTPFIAELTSITEEDLADAPIFEDFLERFSEDFDVSEYVFVAWGNYDRSMLDRMCRLWGAPEIPFKGYINLKNSHKRFYDFSKERGLARAMRHANIPFEGFHHRGIDDAKATAKIFLDLVQKGWEPKFDQ